jgi:uncharacterized membrane protein
MAVSNCLIIYSYVLRGYCLLLVLSIFSMLVFVKTMRNKFDGNRSIVMIVVVNGLLVYVHYSAWLLISAQYIWLLFADSGLLRRFTMAIVIVALCFIPWILVIVYASMRVTLTIWDHFSDQGAPQFDNVVELFRSFNGGFASTELTLGGTIVCLSILISVLIFGTRYRSLTSVYLEPLPLLTWIVGFCIAISLIVAATFGWSWHPRFVIIVIGPYALLLAASAFRLSSARSRAAAVIFVIGWSTVAGLAPTMGLTTDLAEFLVGPNAPPYWLAG